MSKHHRSNSGSSGRFVRGGALPAGFAALGLFAGCVAPDVADVADEDLTDTHVSKLSASASAVAAPSPGAPGLGDPLYPTLGNGGYLVDHYDLGLRYPTATPVQTIAGTATILAHATQALSRLNLDFAGDSVGAVTVNGRAAAASWQGEELIITPAAPIANGAPFLVTVQFTASSSPALPNNIEGNRFFATPSASAWVLQPDGAHQIFPCNDHPSDKASFSFRVDVPAGTTAIANGEQLAKLTAFGRSYYFFTQLQPMATELAQLAVGDLTIIDRGSHGGVRVRDAVPTPYAAATAPRLAIEIEQLAWLESVLGPYPFTSYGSLSMDAPIGFALEDQTLSLFDYRMFLDASDRYKSIMVHELAHQWFGDSVAPARWSDVWLNEGHASWYELISMVGDGSPAQIDQFHQIYNLSDLFRAFFGPVAAPIGGNVARLFNSNVYYGGALSLFALRQEVGDATFQQIQREWVRRYRHQSATTANFIALSSEIAGRDLTGFLTAWLYGTTTPPMPGYPDWVPMTTPPPPPGGALAAASAASVLDPVALGLPPLHHH